MKTANDFAKAAIEIGQLADRLKPADVPGQTAPYQLAQQLAVCYLRLAASKTKEIAEAMAAAGK